MKKFSSLKLTNTYLNQYHQSDSINEFLSAFYKVANIYFNCADLTAIDVGLLLCKIIVINFYIATAERLDRNL